MGDPLGPEEERFLAYIVKGVHCCLTTEKTDKKMVETHNEFVKNLQKVDDYIAELKSRDLQTGWYFSVPKSKKKICITENYNFENQEVFEYALTKRPPLPKMTSWTAVRRNVIALDEDTLHHMPYIEDSVVSDIDWQNNLLYLYDDRVHMPANHHMTDDILSEIADVMTANSWGEGDVILPPNLKAPAKPIVVDEDLAFELISFYVVNYAFSPEELKEKYRDYQRLKNKKGLYKETIPNIDKDQDAVYSRKSALNSYHVLFCRQCFTYDCLSHNFVRPIHKPQTEEDLSRCTKPCGEDCFLKVVSKGHQDPIQIDLFTFAERTLFNVLVVTFQRHFCSVARTLGTKSCAEVHAYYHKGLTEEERASIKQQLSEGRKWSKAARSMSTTRSKAFWEKYKAESARKRKTGGDNSSENGASESDQQKFLDSYKPCDHPGVSCTMAEKCECKRRGTFCEKFCNCLRSCGNRFTGCKCKGACNNGKCPCFCASRECDPDLCKSCGAAELDLLDRRETLKCRNVAIQRGWHKHLLLGASDVSGWGVFLNDFASKGELIAEYCGETISHEEADRRGKVYDKGRTSYLFNLNGDQVVDAKRKGNKIRFANHSALNANCEQLIRMVNGDSRIGLYASRPIQAGEELFFDYCYEARDHLDFVCIELGTDRKTTKK